MDSMRSASPHYGDSERLPRNKAGLDVPSEYVRHKLGLTFHKLPHEIDAMPTEDLMVTLKIAEIEARIAPELKRQ